MAWISGLLGGAQIGAQVWGAQSATAVNKQVAEEQMSWMERMSNTAEQRRVDDLKKAGLNPYLAVSSGGVGAAAVPGSPGFAGAQNPTANVSGAVSSAIQSAQTSSQIDLNKSQAITNAAQANRMNVEAAKAAGVDTSKVESDMDVNRAHVALMQIQGDATAAQARLSQQQIAESQARIPQIAQSIKESFARVNEIGARAALEDAQQQYQQLANDQQQLINPDLAKKIAAEAYNANMSKWESTAQAEFWAGIGSMSPQLKMAAMALSMARGR